jgi:carbonic anhydrase
MNFVLNVAAAVALAFVGGCQTGNPSRPISQAEQQAISPDQALARLVEGNRRFVAGRSRRRDYPAEVRATAQGQFPFAVVLSCIDSRSTPEVVFDQGIGDLFVTRIAGNYVQADILGGMEFGAKVSGARLIVILGHTECGAVKGACDNVELGNLTTVVRAIRPAVDEIREPVTDRASKNKGFLLAVTGANIRRTVTRVRQESPILRELEEAGRIKIIGALQDLTTGDITFLK